MGDPGMRSKVLKSPEKSLDSQPQTLPNKVVCSLLIKTIAVMETYLELLIGS